MNSHLSRLAACCCMLIALANSSALAADFEWQTAAPESQGLSTPKLDALRDGIAKISKTLYIVRNDRVVYEWYASDFAADKPHFTASLAKALVGGVTCAVAITDGQISL